ncbi:MAG: molybdopterin-dependent oxidoreductase [Dehalococcoidia bacterium]|nr:molybdopterin-dependent oxidoreductase [Dehalococcoidia bacterium]
MSSITRRDFLKLGAATASLLAMERGLTALVDAGELDKGGRSVSRTSGVLRTAIPSTCLQCPAGCGILGFVEDGRLVKIEGNPKHPNSRGRLCSKGLAGINQLYDPDRILYPMRRTGARGEGKWKRISWEEAYTEIAGRMKDLRSAGRQKEVVFQSSVDRSAGFMSRFFRAYGSTSLFDEPFPSLGSKKIGLRVAMGTEFDLNDVANTKYILNFGCNPYESHTMHNSFVQRIVDGRMAGAKLVTLDCRLSNTAGRSDEWIPLMPGTDGIVALAMANIIMQEGLYDKEFIANWVNYSADKLTTHLAKFTPAMAEQYSGIKAADIIRIAREFATTKPATTISLQGASSHANGTQAERSINLLNALTGNIDIRGGCCLPSQYDLAEPDPVPPGKRPGPLSATFAGARLDTLPQSHKLMMSIKEGTQKVDMYITHMHNPAFSQPNAQLTIEVLRDERLIPFFVAVDPYLGEGTSYSDIILPDAIYLERWEVESLPSYERIPFVSLRQPVVKPLGESVQFTDVLIELAKRIGGMEQYFQFYSTQGYISTVLQNFDGLTKAGGLEFLKKNGVWTDAASKPAYKTYEKAGFRTPSGKYEVLSGEFSDRQLPALPDFEPVKAHQTMGDDEFVLVLFKQNVQTLSRTANCKWLSEISHEMPIWLNRDVAQKQGIERGDLVKLSTSLGAIRGRVALTNGIHPKVIALASSGGHWEYGRIAQAKSFPSADPDTKLIWWEKSGSISVNANLIVPIVTDNVSRQQAWKDTVVKLAKA